MNSVPVKHVYTRERMLAWLENLEKASGASLTVSLKANASDEEIKNHLKHVPAKGGAIGHCEYHAARTKTGSFIMWGQEHGFLIEPPFPVNDSCVTPELDVATLRAMLSQDYLVAFILVRLGAFAVGVARGEELLTSKVGTGNVHGRHRQGGSSAHRFERHRDKQIEYFVTRLCEHARAQIEPYERKLDYLVYGGSTVAIETVQKQCGFIAHLKTPLLPPQLDIPDPRLPVLKAAVRDAWSSTVYEFRDD
jgi:peptide subunit release factor 1 (eRF1)